MISSLPYDIIQDYIFPYLKIQEIKDLHKNSQNRKLYDSMTHCVCNYFNLENIKQIRNYFDFRLNKVDEDSKISWNHWINIYKKVLIDLLENNVFKPSESDIANELAKNNPYRPQDDRQHVFPLGTLIELPFSISQTPLKSYHWGRHDAFYENTDKYLMRENATYLAKIFDIPVGIKLLSLPNGIEEIDVEMFCLPFVDCSLTRNYLIFSGKVSKNKPIALFKWCDISVATTRIFLVDGGDLVVKLSNNSPQTQVAFYDFHISKNGNTGECESHNQNFKNNYEKTRILTNDFKTKFSDRLSQINDIDQLNLDLCLSDIDKVKFDIQNANNYEFTYYL